MNASIGELASEKRSLGGGPSRAPGPCPRACSSVPRPEALAITHSLKRQVMPDAALSQVRQRVLALHGCSGARGSALVEGLWAGETTRQKPAGNQLTGMQTRRGREQIGGERELHLSTGILLAWLIGVSW